MTRRGPTLAPLALASLLAGACSSAAEAAPHAGAPEHMAPEPWTAALESLLAREIPADEPGGMLLIARGPRVLFQRARGLADVSEGTPLRAESVFGIGSLTKSFTAAAVLVLATDGALRLEDDVRLHVAEAPTHGRAVTLEQLLTHTSGLGNLIDDPDFETWARTERTQAELLAELAQQPLHFEPGTGYLYSDSGYHLLGAVIERASGLPYAEFLEQRLLRPLGMAHTGMLDAPELAALQARGYTLVEGEIAPSAPLHPSVAHAAGALASDAGDLLRWIEAWRGGEIVRSELVARAWQPRALPDGTRGTTSTYGFGWNLCALDGRPTVEHGGWINGFTASLVHLVDEDLTAIALVNRDAGLPDADALARRALRVLLSGSPEVPVVELSAAQRAALAGDYRLPGGELRAIRERDGALTSRRAEGEELSLLALSPTELAFAGSEGTHVLCFELGPDGRARSVQRVLKCAPLDLALREPLD